MGLLNDYFLNPIDRTKQNVKASLGLLADNPQEWLAQLGGSMKQGYEGAPLIKNGKLLSTKEYMQQPAVQAMASNPIALMGTTSLPKSMQRAEAFPEQTLRMGDIGFDKRFDPRKLEQQKLHDTTVTTKPREMYDSPLIGLDQFEGYPFITSMSDRTAAGSTLTGVNGVRLNRPVDLRGGQDFMFDNNPGQVWASAQQPVKQIMQAAQLARGVTGKDPLFIPWRMAPSGGDFANMTGETMLSFGSSNMSPSVKAAANSQIKKFIPDWAGIDSPKSVDQFRTARDQTRKAVKNTLDTNFREDGGLSIGQARLAVADPFQLSSADGGIMNVGQIFADNPMIQNSGHPAYPRGLPGQGIGALNQDHNIFDLLPNVVKERNIANPSMPGITDLRALQMKPYGGLITDDILKKLGY